MMGPNEMLIEMRYQAARKIHNESEGNLDSVTFALKMDLTETFLQIIGRATRQERRGRKATA